MRASDREKLRLWDKVHTTLQRRRLAEHLGHQHDELCHYYPHTFCDSYQLWKKLQALGLPATLGT